MAKVLLLNPRRRKRRARRAMRANPVRRRRSRVRKNPFFGAKRAHRRAARKGWRHRARRHSAMKTNPRVHRRRFRRNPRGLSINSFLKNTLIPGSVGAAGALGLDILLGFVPLPAQLQTGMLKPVVRLAGALALGMIAGKVVNRSVGEQVAAGATIVVLYDVFKAFARTAMPTLPLSGMYPNLEYYSPGQTVGEYYPPALTVVPGGGVVQPPMRAMSEYMYGS